MKSHVPLTMVQMQTCLDPDSAHLLLLKKNFLSTSGCTTRHCVIPGRPTSAESLLERHKCCQTPHVKLQLEQSCLDAAHLHHPPLRHQQIARLEVAVQDARFVHSHLHAAWRDSKVWTYVNTVTQACVMAWSCMTPGGPSTFCNCSHMHVAHYSLTAT